MSHSQFRPRKVSEVPVRKPSPAARVRGNVPKASGDTGIAVKHESNGKSKNKIPRSVRYELENALLGLCDVWFEEIKPHLMRNNIKVHVHDDAGVSVASPAGDKVDERLPAGAPGCSHLDPGAASDRRRRQSASCVDCYSTRPTVLRVQSRRQQQHRSQDISTLPIPPSRLTTQVGHTKERDGNANDSLFNRLQKKEEVLNSTGCNSEKKSPCKPRIRRKRPQPLSPSKMSERRRRRAYSAPAPAPALAPASSPATAHSPFMRSTRTTCLSRPYTRTSEHYIIRPRNKPKLTKNKSTQTDIILPLRYDQDAFSKVTPCAPSELLIERRRPRRRSSVATNIVPRRCKHRTHLNTQETPLFSDDLINIIGEEYDKRLMVLYKNTTQKEYPSTMNLVSNVPFGKPPIRKISPWR